MVLSKENNPHILELVRSAVKMYETDDRFDNTDLFKYHLLILNELEKTNDENGKNDRIINGGLHILIGFGNLLKPSALNLASLNRPLLIKSKANIFDELKFSTYEPCLKLMMTLLNPKNYFLAELKQLLQQCLGRLDITEIQPPEYRSKMYFIQAMIFKLENNPVQSLCSVHNALLSYPFNTVMTSLVLFMNHSYFHSTLRQSLIEDIKYDSLNLSNITPPIQIMNLNFLQRTERLILLKKYERAIVKRLADNNPIQAAYSYIDLSMVTSSGLIPFVTSLVMSCLYFYKAMTDTTCKTAELYAYRSIIFDISVEVFLFTRHYLPLYIQMYIYKLLYTLILRSTDIFATRIATDPKRQKIGSELIINDTYETILDELLKNILHISNVSPFTHAPATSMIHDMIYMDYAGSEFLSKYLKFMSTSSSIYQYYYFDGVWKGWIDNEQFIDQRENCMQALLYDHDWIMNDVEDLLYWPIVPRTPDGWLLNAKHRLQIEQPGYSQVIGITLNNDTGDIELMLTQAKKNEHNLFDAADIMDVLTNSITFAYFTLDPPSTEYHSHPFNEIRYIPKRLSKIPNYLLTLLHTDYLLKMFSTGVEICSFQPFEMRSSTENLMQRLPVYIREELQAITLKESGIITDSVHRFWIQPESTIEYEQTSYKGFFGRTNENITQLYLNDNIKMCVKQHRMKYDETDNLVDDERDTGDDQSAEAQFARIFTKYYDVIGEYFPELLRLKELLKLNILSRIIQARYKSQIDSISQLENDPSLDKHLKEVKKTVGRYPTGTREFDEKVVNTMAKTLSKQFYCKKGEAKPYIIDWLKSGQGQTLIQYAKQSLIEQKAKLKFTIEKLNLFYDDSNDDDDTMTSDLSKCSWVPAAFSLNLNIKVYGGIALNSNLKETSGIKVRQEKSKSIIKENLAKMFATVSKQKSKKQGGGSQKGELLHFDTHTKKKTIYYRYNNNSRTLC